MCFCCFFVFEIELLANLFALLSATYLEENRTSMGYQLNVSRYLHLF